MTDANVVILGHFMIENYQRIILLNVVNVIAQNLGLTSNYMG